MPAFRGATLLLIVGCVWWALSALAGEPRVRVTVESGAFTFEPAWIRLRVQVDPDEANRGLLVAAVSEGFETSSFEQLEGRASRRSRWLQWRDLPAGVYTVVATVDRRPERPWKATAGFSVLGRD